MKWIIFSYFSNLKFVGVNIQQNYQPCHRNLKFENSFIKYKAFFWFFEKVLSKICRTLLYMYVSTNFCIKLNIVTTSLKKRELVQNLFFFVKITVNLLLTKFKCLRKSQFTLSKGFFCELLWIWLILWIRFVFV